MKKNSYILILFLAAACPAIAQNARFYVDQQATGANTGLSWTDAWTDLQLALQAAQPGDDVWVAEGIYRPTTSTDRNRSFEPKSGVQVYGGFAGTENSLDARDWAANPTVLSGDIGNMGDSTDNSYNVMYLNQPDSNTVVDGFILRDGLANGTDGGAYDRTKCGGGLYIMGKDWEAYPTIQNCTFEHNTAKNYGGGTMVNGTGDGSVAPQFISCTFENNRALNSGGGLMWLGASWVEREKDIFSCNFYKNNAGTYGGGLYVVDSERADRLNTSDCQFIENKAFANGGGIYLSMGRESGSYLSIEDSKFKNNEAKDASTLYVGSQNFLYLDTINIQNCNFSSTQTNLNNVSSSVIIINPLGTSESEGEFSNCKIEGNTNINNTVIFFEWNDAIVKLEKLEINSNKSNSSLAFLSSSLKFIILNSKFYQNNAEVLFNHSNISILEYANCLIYGNNLPSGRFFYSQNVNKFNFQRNTLTANYIEQVILAKYPDSFFIRNSIINGTNDNISFLRYTVFTALSHSYFDTLSCAALPANVTCGPGILTGIDPLFVYPDSGDFRLQPCSPLINAGSNDYLDPGDSTDLAGLPRVRSGTVDIGAYESQGPALAAVPTATPSCPGGAAGSIAVAVQDACPPLHIDWHSGAASGFGLQGLPAGDYAFTLTDARGQSLTFSATVPEGPAPQLLAASTPVVCGDTLGGSVSATLDAGAPPFAYAWAGTAVADSLRSGLPAAAYPVTVTDANGCSATGIAEVHKLGNLDADISVGQISCPGAADGSFTVLPANGKAPFSWHWDAGATTSTLGPIGPGNYLGTLTDALGCSLSWVLPLDEPAMLLLHPQVTPASDSMAATGSVALNPSGGTPPYSAHWSTGADGLLLDSLAAGIYTVTLTDGPGCSVVETVTVGVTSGTGEAGAAAPALSVWPNPAREAVWVSFGRPLPADARVRLLNAAGAIAGEWRARAGAERLLLRTTGLPRGMYFVQVEGALRRLVLE